MTSLRSTRHRAGWALREKGWALKSMCGRRTERVAQESFHPQRDGSALTFPVPRAPARASLCDRWRAPAPTEMHPESTRGSRAAGGALYPPTQLRLQLPACTFYLGRCVTQLGMSALPCFLQTRGCHGLRLSGWRHGLSGHGPSKPIACPGPLGSWLR